MRDGKAFKEYFTRFDINKLCFIVSVILFVFMYFSVLRFILSTGISLLNSDASAEMILANQLNNEGAFLTSRNWFYSSELRVLNTELIYRIGLAVFPNNWHWARLLSDAIFLLILAGCMIWLMCVTGHRNYAFWVANAVIAPIGCWYGWNVIFSSFYVPHIAISAISLALMCEIVKNKNTSHNLKKNICLFLLLLLGFMAGLGGVRQLMICYAPLFAVGIIIVWISNQFPADTFPAKSIFIVSFVLCVISGIGYLVNLTYLSKHYSFNSYAGMAWGEFELSDLLSSISSFISLFGWQSGVPVLSLAGIVNVLSLLLVAAIFFSTIYLIIRIKSLSANEIIVVLFFCMTFLINLLILSGTKQDNESYWLPILPFAFIPLFIIPSKLTLPQPKEIVLLGSYGLLLFLTGYLTMKNPYVVSSSIGPVPDDLNILSVADWLDETDYTQGIATFWNSSILTELSNNRIEMWTIEEHDDDLTRSLTPRLWLQSVEHAALPQGKVFLLFTIRELGRLDLPGALEEYIVYVDDNYVAYGFDDISQYFELISEQANNKHIN